MEVVLTRMNDTSTLPFVHVVIIFLVYLPAPYLAIRWDHFHPELISAIISSAVGSVNIGNNPRDPQYLLPEERLLRYVSYLVRGYFRGIDLDANTIILKLPIWVNGHDDDTKLRKREINKLWHLYEAGTSRQSDHT
ncbi:hypothetical protein F4679DRAFT_583906 [Xylaria curta]|nr:hypothetical protein F4679DRAFT_583906 [Xylaria curta]